MTNAELSNHLDHSRQQIEETIVSLRHTPKESERDVYDLLRLAEIHARLGIMLAILGFNEKSMRGL